ncbi:MAG TPA: type I DNA topoisomerase, partial [Deltaproteobacteria bacterium]|nr:type I DNA topoisomerase [Deltaproteobacteria bacterium]
MKKSLVIVESPAKARTINKYLGKDFRVMASIGHIKDLPKNKLGVDIDKDFEPHYEIIRGKAKVIKELKKASKDADIIFLGPDPDREGEAIAWHIKEVLNGRREGIIKRVLFNEITEKGIKEAIAHPTEIDKNKVDAQQARRVLDRLVGYQVSPLLWEKVRMGLSAGRVQSVAVRLICEREREIESFVPQEYWSITAIFDGFEAKLVKKDGKKITISTEEEAKSIVSELKGETFKVEEIEQKQRKRNPAPPFITSRLQQEASRRLGFSAQKTMVIAQQLYEGVDLGEEGPTGLITYMRTDSHRIAPEAIQAVRGYIEKTYGKEYLPKKPNVYKSKKTAQEAHEAIRPTNMKYTPEYVKPYLTEDQWKLYELIWKRFVASQMHHAILDQTRVSIGAGKYTFQAVGTVVRFHGFTILYEEKTDEESEEEKKLPPLEKDMVLKLLDLVARQHFTQPPPRYTEASLIRELEEKGIGRPSTYALILSTIQDRGYVVKEKGRLKPTELGFLVTELLVKSFPDILNVQFTAHLEEELDRVEEGKLKWIDVIKEFYSRFREDLERAKEEMQTIKGQEEPTDIPCKKCGRMMVIK